MVTDMTRGERRDDDRTDDRPDRAQVILVGAVALAFIVLGVVVVFNGVLYTETLTSGESSQSASTAERTDLEIEQGVACLVAGHDDDFSLNDSEPNLGGLSDSQLDEEIERYEALYRNSTANARPAAVGIERASDEFTAGFFSDGANVNVTYDSGDHSYDRTLTVTAADCPQSPTIEEWNVTPINESENEYRVDWTVTSSHSNLSRVNTTLVAELGDDVIAEETTAFDGERRASGYHRLRPDNPVDRERSVSHIRISVRNEADYVTSDTESID